MTTDPRTPMSDDPEVLRAQIAQTRSNLSRDVNALGEAVSPSNVAQRQAEKVKDTVRGAGRDLKERIMGSDDPYDTSPGLGERAQMAASDAGHAVSDAADSARQALADAPAQARRRAQGNPLAAGLIALGAGWLVGSLLPGSERERQLAVDLKHQVEDSGAVEQVKAVAQEVVDDVRPQAEQAVEQVKQSAQGSAEHVKDEAATTAQGVQDHAQDSAKKVQEDQQQS